VNTTKAFVSLTVILVLLSPPALAQALDDSVSLKYFDDSIQVCQALLNQWQNDWKIAVGAAILVVILGAVSAVLQGFQSQQVKIATIVCGLVVTIVTGLTNTVGWDHRELRRSIAKGQLTLAQMNQLRAFYTVDKDDDNKRDMLAQFGKYHTEFVGLQAQPEAVAQADDFGDSIINTAYAADDAGPPSWVRTIPEDAKNLYFVGVADSAKLGDAKSASKDNAIQNAASFLAGSLSAQGGELDVDKLTLSLAQASEDAGNYVSIDEKNGIYRYYSLIRINKSVAEAQVNLFAVQHGMMAPVGLIKALGDTQRVRDDYTARQLEHYEALLNQTSAALSKDEYQQFSEARELRKDKKDYEKAIAMLNGILEKNPQFYMGWYNLALAYAASGNDAAARKSYDKTIALEPAQPMRDATLYNAYGHFLYEKRQYCEAITQFEKAVQLDQSNPRAQNNLQQARSRLQETGTVCR